MGQNELIKRLETEQFDLFGTGFTAGMLMEGLIHAGLEGGIGVFVVSGPVEKGRRFFGRPVLSLSEYMEQRASGESRLLLAAVHGSILREVTEAVSRSEEQAGLRAAVRIAPAGPLIQRLLYGEPVSRRDTELSELLGAQPENQYWIAVRYAAVLAAAGELPEGEAIYKKALSLFSGQRTAEKRYQTVGDLLESVKAGGFRPDSPIQIDERGQIIDGLHRLAVCFYLGLERIPCEVFRVSPLYGKVLGEKNRLPEELFFQAGFTEQEQAILRGLQNALMCAGRRDQAEAPGGPPAVSVILPVYNVADYMDRCLRTVTAQSFRDLEILLINDGSRDSSGEHCRFWARRDRRVRFTETENRGVSPARNLGVRMARGTYLMFVDPDDWLDLRMAEKLFRAAERSGADFTECDLWRYDNRSGKKIHRHLSGVMGVPWTREEHMVYGATATYKSLVRRSLWVDNGIHLPECSFESPAVYSLVLGLANRIESVPEPLYYYRRYRENSLIETGYAGKDGRPDPRLGIDAMEFLVAEYRRTGIYDRYRDILERVVKYRLSDILAMQYHRRTEAEFSALAGAYRAFLAERFPERNERYLVLGGYNLNRVLLHLPLLQDPSLRFNFSSLAAVVSAFDRAGDTESFTHRNRYREMMLNRERQGAFWRILKEVRPEFLFLDFMEERFALLRDGDRIVTESDAFLGAEGRPAMEKPERLERGTAECEAVMADAIRRFPALVRQVSPGTRIVVIESELSLSVGSLEHLEPFPDQEELQSTNQRLRGYYRLLEKSVSDTEQAAGGGCANSGALFLKAAERPFYFTDRDYEYGAVPSHLNELVNRDLAEALAGELWK